MSREEDKPDTTPEPSETDAKPAKKFKFGKLAILGFVAAVIVVECGAAYFFLASAGNATEPARGSAASKTAGKSEPKEAKHEAKRETKAAAEHEPGGDQDPADQVEVVLGEFSVTAYQPATNTTLRIEFNLYGTVGAKEQKEFMTALEENQHRFREQVIVIVRSAEITDLTDAGLGLVKRKILEKTNRMIAKPLLRSVIFSDFSFIEQ